MIEDTLMPLKATYEERIEEVVRIARTSKLSPGQTFVRIMQALDYDFGSGEQLDAIWADYYDSQALGEVARLNAEVAELRRNTEKAKP